VPGLLKNLPNPTLGAVVIAASLSLADIRGTVRLWHQRRVEFLLSITAFLGVALLGVLQGIAVAVALSIFNVFRRAWRPYETTLGRVPGLRGQHDVRLHPDAEQLPGLVIFRFDAPVFFANARTFRSSGGLFLDMMIHDFDMARFVTGSEVVEVFARGTVRVAPDFATVGDIDTALVTLVHASGCLTAIDNSRRAAYGFDQRVEVFGSLGMAASDNPYAHSGVLTTAAGAQRPPLPHFFLERYLASYEREWEAFIGALRRGTAPPLDLAGARAPLVIGLAAWESLHEGRPVRLEELAEARGG
jgi:predicted dehydrogenase